MTRERQPWESWQVQALDASGDWSTIALVGRRADAVSKAREVRETLRADTRLVSPVTWYKPTASLARTLSDVVTP